ncbi:hypothetical protein AGLY_016728 [Aphis glycines]|uniref:Uncharacterized protein n=1 Tax=Aphis glycines TaxID=307491 RepID=A0A6G0SX09_APHGL|nr:hypothetical protein AGLY_016728 [Aphis glycines]
MVFCGITVVATLNIKFDCDVSKIIAFNYYAPQMLGQLAMKAFYHRFSSIYQILNLTISYTGNTKNTNVYHKILLRICKNKDQNNCKFLNEKVIEMYHTKMVVQEGWNSSFNKLVESANPSLWNVLRSLIVTEHNHMIVVQKSHVYTLIAEFYLIILSTNIRNQVTNYANYYTNNYNLKGLNTVKTLSKNIIKILLKNNYEKRRKMILLIALENVLLPDCKIFVSLIGLISKISVTIRNLTCRLKAKCDIITITLSDPGSAFLMRLFEFTDTTMTRWVYYCFSLSRQGPRIKARTSQLQYFILGYNVKRQGFYVYLCSFCDNAINDEWITPFWYLSKEKQIKFTLETSANSLSLCLMCEHYINRYDQDPCNFCNNSQLKNNKTLSLIYHFNAFNLEL